MSGGSVAAPVESNQPMTPVCALCRLSYNEDVLYYTGQPKRLAARVLWRSYYDIHAEQLNAPESLSIYRDTRVGILILATLL